LAAVNNQINTIELLLQNGANLESESDELGTPFEWAVVKNFIIFLIKKIIIY